VSIGLTLLEMRQMYGDKFSETYGEYCKMKQGRDANALMSPGVVKHEAEMLTTFQNQISSCTEGLLCIMVANNARIESQLKTRR